MTESDHEERTLFTGITRQTLLIVLNFFFMGLIGVISWKVVASNLTLPDSGGLSEVGIVNFAIGFAGLFSFITNLGFGSAHVKRVSEGQDLGKCIGTYFTIQVMSIFVFIITVVGSIFIWKNVMNRGFESVYHEYTIYIILGYFAANNLSTVAQQTFIGRIEIAKNQIVVLIGAFIQLIVTIIVVTSVRDTFLYAMTFVVGAFTNLGISFYFLLKLPIKRPSWDLFKSYFVFSIPMFIVTVMSQLATNIDKVMVQLFWDSYNVGVYVGGQKFSVYLIMISTGIGTILFPTFSRLKSSGREGHIRNLTYSSERLIAMFMGPFCAVVFALSIPIVTLLGDTTYAASYLILQPLAIWSYFKSLSTPYRNLIMGIGKPKILAIVSIVSLVSIVGFNLIFIPKDIKIFGIELLGMGARGAAIGTLLSAVVTFVVFRFFTYRYQKVFLNIKIFKFVFASVLTGAGIYGLEQLYPADNIFLLVLYAMAGIILYTIILVPLKGFNKEDWILFREVISPMAMIKYLKDELFKR